DTFQRFSAPCYRRLPDRRRLGAHEHMLKLLEGASDRREKRLRPGVTTAVAKATAGSPKSSKTRSYEVRGGQPAINWYAVSQLWIAADREASALTRAEFRRGPVAAVPQRQRQCVPASIPRRSIRRRNRGPPDRAPPNADRLAPPHLFAPVA